MLLKTVSDADGWTGAVDRQDRHHGCARAQCEDDGQSWQPSEARRAAQGLASRRSAQRAQLA